LVKNQYGEYYCNSKPETMLPHFLIDEDGISFVYHKNEIDILELKFYYEEDYVFVKHYEVDLETLKLETTEIEEIAEFTVKISIEPESINSPEKLEKLINNIFLLK
jgi:hypothetical protein